MIPRRCPVCWQVVESTPTRWLVSHHPDSLGHDTCPMTGHLFQLCYPLVVDPKLRGAA